MNFEITFSPIILTKKPETTSEKSLVKLSLNKRIDVDLYKLKALVLQHAFCLMISNKDFGALSNKDFLSQQVFAIDVDDNRDPDEFIKLCTEKDFLPNIVYSSFSDTPEYRKWRAIWVLDMKETNIDIATMYIKSLINMFESDKQCKDVSRMFYPGNKILYFNDEINPLNQSYLDMLCNLYKINHRGCQFKSENVTSILYTIEDPFLALNQPPKMLDNYDMVKAINEIKVLQYFLSDVKVSNKILTGLVSNLMYVNGGIILINKQMKRINDMGGAMSEKGRISKYDKDDLFMPAYFKSKKYMPYRLSQFSPYEEDYRFHNMLDLKNFNRGGVELLLPHSFISLEDADSIYNMNIKRIMNNINPTDLFDMPNPTDYNKIYIIKVSTGYGKTERLTKLKDTLIAVPTNKLKNELYSRMKIKCLVTPDYPVFSSSELNDKINGYYNAELYTNANKIIKEVSDGSLIDFDITDNDILMASNYIFSNKECRETTKTVITTHARALHDPSFKHRLFVFDEDPLSSLVKTNTSNLSFCEFDNTIFDKDIENFYRGITCSNIYNNNKVNVSSELKELCLSKNRSDIIGLLTSDYIYRDELQKGMIIHHRKIELPHDKDIIILSATPNISIYKEFYNDKLDITDISNIKTKGKMKQYTNRSYSTSSMTKYIKNGMGVKIVEDIRSIVGNIPIITHMKHKKILGDGNMYFGNCAGYDEYKGLDIAIVGTPNKPEHIVKLYAHILAIDMSNEKMEYRVIEYNNMRFKYMTYSNIRLQKIQLEMVENELLQAIGRARILREECTVYILSNFPIIGASYDTKTTKIN